MSGGVGSEGTVQEVGGRDESWNSVLDILWDSGSSNRYRLGLGGKVDLHAVNESSGGFVYAEHLPKLCKAFYNFPVFSLILSVVEVFNCKRPQSHMF